MGGSLYSETMEGMMSEPNSNLEDHDAQEALVFYDGGAYNAPSVGKPVDREPDSDRIETLSGEAD